jgi:hypothetical protein
MSKVQRASIYNKFKIIRLENKMIHVKRSDKIGQKLILSAYLIIFLITLTYIPCIFSPNSNYRKNYNELEYLTPKSSFLWGWINFTNSEIDGTIHFHGDSVIIEGRLFHYYTNASYSGYTISLVDNGYVFSSYNDVTDIKGRFQILYDIPFSGDIYTPHNISAEVTNPGGAVEFLNSIVLYYRAQSFFDINYPNTPALAGENLNLDGYIRYDNGSAIPDIIIYYYWYDNTVLVDSNTILTDNTGYISSIPIPDIISDSLSVKLNYSSSQINYSEIFIANPKIFSNITCFWELPTSAVEYNSYTIAGYLASRTDNSIFINDRSFRIYYNGSYLQTVSSDATGYFSYTFNLPAGSGVSFIGVELENSIGKFISTLHFIDVEEGSPPPASPNNDIPFLGFFLVFIPVISGVVLGLIGYGYYYYRKQDKLSRIVNLPLESRILNLKILKESGRLEESISYLFNGIYMELINARYGRSRKVNETIRDFAIVSVKDLKLNPTSIYPFIQKIEEIIYAKPFQISDKQFYDTIELFSPVYFQLTGYNFKLNF